MKSLDDGPLWHSRPVSMMPSYGQLRDLPADVVAGALTTATAVWDADHEHPWLRDGATWAAIGEALAAAAACGTARATKPPRWLPALVRRTLRWLAGHHHWTRTDFVAIRTLERLGMVSLDIDDDYVLAMVSGFNATRDGGERAGLFAEDPELVERALWRLFEVEGGGEVSLANVDKFSPPESSWQRTFLQMVADGALPRDRVLECCLRALGRDFSAYRAGWFGSLYRALEPTGAEQAARQAALVGLLGSPIGATVTLAARGLVAVDAGGGLDDRRFLDGCEAGLTARAKAAVTLLVRVLEQIAKRAPALRSEVAARAGLGMQHPDPAVQSRALRLLRSLDAAETARAGLDTLDPSVRQQAESWLGAGVAGPASPPQDPPVPPADPVAALPPAHPLSQMAGDVLDRWAVLLEEPGDPIELELGLAALATMLTPEVTLAPLLPRASKLARAEPGGAGLRGHLAWLVCEIAGRAAPAPGEPGGVTRHLAQRLREVAARPGPLFATPTDSQGWVDPDALVRLALKRAPTRMDGIAALLRLAPEGRDVALKQAAAVSGAFGAALRHALGGPPEPITNPALWVAASRSRVPLHEDPHVIAHPLPGAGQGRPATCDLKVTGTPYRHVPGGQEYRGTSYEWELVATPPARHARPDQPTVAAAGELGDWPDRFWLAWHALTWPHDAEPYFAQAINPVLFAAYHDEVAHEAAPVLDTLLRHPGRLGRMAALTLAAGLAIKAPEHHVRAVDAFVALVPAGRIPAVELADAMALLAGLCKPARWAARLADAAVTVPTAVQDILTRLLPAMNRKATGMSALLRVLHEETLRAHGTVTDPTLRAWLDGFDGTSQAARAARALRKL